MVQVLLAGKQLERDGDQYKFHFATPQGYRLTQITTAALGDKLGTCTHSQHLAFTTSNNE